MKKYRIRIEPLAITDIREITYWYNQQLEMLGKRFQDTTVKQINKLAKDPISFAIR